MVDDLIDEDDDRHLTDYIIDHVPSWHSLHLDDREEIVKSVRMLQQLNHDSEIGYQLLVVVKTLEYLNEWGVLGDPKEKLKKPLRELILDEVAKMKAKAAK